MNKQTTTSRKKLINISADTKQKKIIAEKLKIKQNTFKIIDWDAIKRSNNVLSAHQRSTRSKFVFRCSFTTTRKATITGVHKLCPLCSNTQETHQHVLTWPSPLAKENRQELLNTLEEGLINIDAHPDLATVVHQGVQQISNLVMDATGHSEEENFQQLRCK